MGGQLQDKEDRYTRFDKEGSNMRDILLFSGGLDSLIGYYYLGEPPVLYCDIGHKYAYKERRVVQEIAKKAKMNLIIEDSLKLGKWEKPDADIPQRNMFLIMMGSYYGDNIHLVVQKGEMSIPDRSKEFFMETSKWVSFLHGKDKRVTTPFSQMTKTQMVKWYLDTGHDSELLLSTTSCYGQEEGNCGQCGACFRRWIALESNGLSEPYVNDIKKWEGIKTYVEKMKSGKYDEERAEETKKVLERYKLW